jgi:hypothetical protein
MSKAEKLLARVNAARAKIGLDATSAGFSYGEAIRLIMEKLNCTYESLGARIGCTGQQVGKIRRGNQLPNHISGELLCGLWKDTFKDFCLLKLPMTQHQRKGGSPDLPSRRKRLVE